MASKFALATSLAVLLMSGTEPKPGPVGEDNGIQSAIMQLETTFKYALQETQRQLNDAMRQQQRQSLTNNERSTKQSLVSTHRDTTCSHKSLTSRTP